MRSAVLPVITAVSALCVALCTGCAGSGPAAVPARPGLAGTWVGGFQDGPDWVFLQLGLEARGDRWHGSFDLPVQFVSGQRLERVEARDGRVAFDVPQGARRWRFEGRRDGGSIAGHVAGDGTRVPFRLERLAAADGDRHTGTYRLDDGRTVHLRRWVELGLGGLLFVESTTGRLGALFPTSGSTYFSGPSALVTHPVESVVRFEAAGDGADRVVWTRRGVEVRGRRVPLREEEVTFANGTVELAGTLVLPEAGAARRHPAVIVAPGGTGAGTREMGRHLADFFALHGVAVLVFDKRGTGASGGDWLRSGFEDLAGDVLAGVRSLRARADIDPERVGLLGFSQGGWVVALAAARSADVAFIISQSGPGVTPLETERYRVEHWLRADGFAEADVQAALRLQGARYEAARTGEGWDAVAVLNGQARRERWYPYVGDTSGPDDPFWAFWRLIRDFDPAPVLRNVRCPVLAVYGEKDTYLPVAKSAAVWREMLDRAGNRDVTVKVFPDADHSLLSAKTGGLRESPRLKQFAPGVLPLLRDWVLAKTAGEADQPDG